MADPKIPLADLPYGLPGAFDRVAGVDTATGAAKQFPMPQAGEPKDYPTRASLPSAAGLTDGTAAHVNNDPNPDNNGRWAVFGGEWVQSADRVTGLEGRVGAVEDDIEDQAETLSRVGAFRSNNGADIEFLTDDRGAVVRRTDQHGEQFLPGIDEGKSVQAELRETRRALAFGSGIRRRDVMYMADANDNVLMRMDERGALYIPGLRMPLQAAAGQTLTPTEFPRTEREKLHPSVKPLIADLVAEGLPFVQPPTLLVPNGYDVPDGFQSAFTVTQEGAGQMLETPYGDGGLVHPHLIEMRTPFLGYRFILGETPHKAGNAWEENPIVYGSNDLKRFDLIPDFEQPLGHPPGGNTGYNSDIAWSYDPLNGKLIAVWRSLHGGEWHHFRTTRDGVAWEPEEVVQSHTGVSPAILYDPVQELWHQWAVPTTGAIDHYTGPSYMGPWAFQHRAFLNSDYGIDVWHIEVKWLGDRFVVLANATGAGGNLWIGLSDDGDAWDMGAPLISPPADHVYKGTFIPEFDGGACRLHVAWNTYAFPLPPGINAAFHVASSNWVDLNSI